MLDNPFIPRAPTDKQAIALTTPAREQLYGGSAGPGKSEFLLMAALQYVHLSGRYSAILFRRTFQDLKLEGALIPRSFEYLGNTSAKWNGQDKKWTFPTGATLSFGYLKYEKHKYRYQSSEFQFIGFDELTQFEQSQYTYMFSRLRRLETSAIPLRQWSASNPGNIGHQWVKKRFITSDNSKRVFLEAYIDDNPHLNTEEYKQSLEELDEEKKKQLLEGDWDSFGGAYFGDLWENDKQVISPLKEIPEGYRIDRSYDWGDSSPSACLWWAKSNGEEIKLRDGTTLTPPPKSLIALNEFYTWSGTPDEGNRMLATEQAKKIKQFEDAREWNVEPGPADSSIFDVRNGSCIADDMQSHDINWEEADKSPGSRINGAQRVRQMLSASKHRDPEEPWLLFTKNCKHSIRTIPTLPSDERNPDDVDTDAEDHAYDSVRYRVLHQPQPTGGGTATVGGF